MIFSLALRFTLQSKEWSTLVGSSVNEPLPLPVVLTRRTEIRIDIKQLRSNATKRFVVRLDNHFETG